MVLRLAVTITNNTVDYNVECNCMYTAHLKQLVNYTTVYSGFHIMAPLILRAMVAVINFGHMHGVPS